MTRYPLMLWLLLAALHLPLAHGASVITAVPENAPFPGFTDDDYKLFFASAKRAAEGPVGADAITWSNTGSGGAYGKVQSTRAFHREEGDCRELSGENTSRGIPEPFRVTVCKGADGQWRLAPTAPEQTPAAAPAADQSGFPANLPASFSGVLPCADCPGTKYMVEFHEDGSYRLRITYLEKGPDRKGANVDETGAWQLVSYGTRVTLRDETNQTSTFLIIDADTLRLVGPKGDEFRAKLNYDLKRDPVYAPIDTGQP